MSSLHQQKWNGNSKEANIRLLLQQLAASSTIQGCPESIFKICFSLFTSEEAAKSCQRHFDLALSCFPHSSFLPTLPLLHVEALPHRSSKGINTWKANVHSHLLQWQLCSSCPLNNCLQNSQITSVIPQNNRERRAWTQAVALLPSFWWAAAMWDDLGQTQGRFHWKTVDSSAENT